MIIVSVAIFVVGLLVIMLEFADLRAEISEKWSAVKWCLRKIVSLRCVRFDWMSVLCDH